MRKAGFDADSVVDTPVITQTGVPGAQYVPPTDSIQSIGASAIAKSVAQRNNTVEFSLAHLPKNFEVFNRAKLGNIQVWARGFDSVTYPEGATDDKSTWLAPGETMNLPLDAVLHFFGNIFSPSFDMAVSVIEACGGFLLEPRGEMHADARNIPPPRIVGGPLYLPDFILTGKDGRNRIAFGPFALYEEYDKLTRRLRKNPILQNKALIASEAELLQERLEEYRNTDAAIYDHNGNPIASAAAA